jgi:hypothetical protein
VLSNKVNFEHRSPTADDEIEVGMVDLHEKDQRIPFGKTRAWCWQQGCMLQRSSRDERSVCIDAVQEGQGRQLHLIDIHRLMT